LIEFPSFDNGRAIVAPQTVKFHSTSHSNIIGRPYLYSRGSNCKENAKNVELYSSCMVFELLSYCRSSLAAGMMINGLHVIQLMVKRREPYLGQYAIQIVAHGQSNYRCDARF
jgi:hypothetical protein